MVEVSAIEERSSDTSPARHRRKLVAIGVAAACIVLIVVMIASFGSGDTDAMDDDLAGTPGAPMHVAATPRTASSPESPSPSDAPTPSDNASASDPITAPAPANPTEIKHILSLPFATAWIDAYEGRLAALAEGGRRAAVFRHEDPHRELVELTRLTLPRRADQVYLEGEYLIAFDLQEKMTSIVRIADGGELGVLNMPEVERPTTVRDRGGRAIFMTSMDNVPLLWHHRLPLYALDEEQMPEWETGIREDGQQVVQRGRRSYLLLAPSLDAKFPSSSLFGHNQTLYEVRNGQIGWRAKTRGTPFNVLAIPSDLTPREPVIRDRFGGRVWFLTDRANQVGWVDDTLPYPSKWLQRYTPYDLAYQGQVWRWRLPDHLNPGQIRFTHDGQRGKINDGVLSILAEESRLTGFNLAPSFSAPDGSSVSFKLALKVAVPTAFPPVLNASYFFDDDHQPAAALHRITTAKGEILLFDREERRWVAAVTEDGAAFTIGLSYSTYTATPKYVIVSSRGVLTFIDRQTRRVVAEVPAPTARSSSGTPRMPRFWRTSQHLGFFKSGFLGVIDPDEPCIVGDRWAELIWKSPSLGKVVPVGTSLVSIAGGSADSDRLYMTAGKKMYWVNPRATRPMMQRIWEADWCKAPSVEGRVGLNNQFVQIDYDSQTRKRSINICELKTGRLIKSIPLAKSHAKFVGVFRDTHYIFQESMSYGVSPIITAISIDGLERRELFREPFDRAQTFTYVRHDGLLIGKHAVISIPLKMLE